MKRTKSSQPPNVVYQPQDEPIVLSKPLLDTLFKQPSHGADMVALYCFYYSTAKWQGTNQPKATIPYVAKGTNWGLDKVRKVKSKLRQLGLIEDITQFGDDGKITGHFIKVNFIWESSTTLGVFQCMENTDINSLRTNNKSKNKKNHNTSPIPKAWSQNKDFLAALDDFVTHRREIKKPLTNIAYRNILIKLAKYTMEVAVLALNASVNSGWRDVFPESVKIDGIRCRHKNFPPPKEIICNYFKGKKDDLYARTFFDTHYRGALSLLVSTNNGEESALADNLIHLYDWINECQTELAIEEGSPTPNGLIGEYIQWLDKQKWLDIEPRLFIPGNSIFKGKFINHINTHYGKHVLTGK